MCYTWAVFDHVFDFSTILIYRTTLLLKSLYIIHLPLWWKSLKGMERFLHLETMLDILF